MKPNQITQSVTDWVNTAQFTVNYSTVALASVAGIILETTAHARAGNPLYMGIPLALASVAIVTVAVITSNRVAWLLYYFQLMVGVAQIYTGTWHSVSLSLLSLSSLVAAYAAANMMSYTVESQRQDVENRAYTEIELAKIEADKQVKIAKVETKARTESTDKPLTKADKQEEAKRLSDNGHSTSDIAEMLGVSPRQVRRYLNGSGHMSATMSNGQG